MAATNKANIDAMMERLNAWFVTNKPDGNFTTVQGKGSSTFRLPTDHPRQQDHSTRERIPTQLLVPACLSSLRTRGITIRKHHQR
jgi:hypothetical protein